MPYKDLIKQKKGDFDAAFEFVKNEVAGIRSGRANTSMIEDVIVDYMGSRLRIKELATINVSDPRTIAIQPWDKGVVPLIDKAIRESPLGLNPMNDGQVIRVNIPALTEERRKEFVRLLRKKIEEARIRVRQVREDILKKVQNEVRAKTAREDDLKNAKDELQKTIDNLNKKFEDLTDKKESELMNS